jgi:alpha-methylacyl-CoA racemase
VAGHDIDFIALSGALHACGPAGGKPVPPLNLIGDFGGGGMMLAFGMLAAMLRARETGKGQVVDCAMVDGSALLMTMMYSMLAAGRWVDRRGANLLDSGSPFYDCYETADGKYVAIGAIEPRFYEELLELVGAAADEELHDRDDASHWSHLRARLELLFRGKTRDEWCALLEGTDTCFAPVLSMAEAPRHPHNIARRTFVDVDGAVQPAPAPRYSATPTAEPAPLEQGPGVTQRVLGDAGYGAAEIETLREAGVVA